MTQIEKEIADQKNDDDIKRIVHGICNHLPKTVGKECNDFVTKYADVVIKLLISTLQPSEICSMLAVCQTSIIQVAGMHAILMLSNLFFIGSLPEEVLDCAICETTVTALDRLLDNPKIDHTMEHVLKKACLALPDRNQQKVSLFDYFLTFYQQSESGLLVFCPTWVF